MCKRCVIFTYDEVLDIVLKLEVGVPLNFSPDWPVRTTEAYPKSVAPLIVPKFDTATSAPAFAPGSLGVRELSWGFEESWKPGVVFNTRIEETYPSPKTGKPIKRQYEFRVPEQDIIFIGCTWRGSTFSMVTTDANADMAPIHHRMPLIVRQEELPLWFGPNYQQLADRSKIRLEAQPA